MDDMPESSSAPSRRVLPSRARRGGPGIGSSEIDNMILDSYRRQSENDPIIPIDTPFILTTSLSAIPKVIPNAKESDKVIVALDRYFDRPDVLEKYRQQKEIQTPEFNKIDSPQVGSRMRPRNEDWTDTSQAAYEKRHRRFETFERRMRIRERDKLKHEQYKLNERIEQLKSLDSSYFLVHSLDNTFPPFNADNGRFETYTGDLINEEGEWRRREMLAHAHVLAQRYRTLLPPDRVHKKAPAVNIPQNVATEPSASSSRQTTTADPPDEREALVEQDEPEVDEPDDDQEDTLSLVPPPRFKHSKSSKKKATTTSPTATKSSRKPKGENPYPVLSPMSQPDITVLDETTGDQEYVPDEDEPEAVEIPPPLPVKRGPGRPRRTEQPVVDVVVDVVKVIDEEVPKIPQPKRNRGRPPPAAASEVNGIVAETVDITEDVPQAKKRKRDVKVDQDGNPVVKRGPGRPSFASQGRLTAPQQRMLKAQSPPPPVQTPPFHASARLSTPLPIESVTAPIVGAPARRGRRGAASVDITAISHTPGSILNPPHRKGGMRQAAERRAAAVGSKRASRLPFGFQPPEPLSTKSDEPYEYMLAEWIISDVQQLSYRAPMGDKPIDNKPVRDGNLHKDAELVVEDNYSPPTSLSRLTPEPGEG